MVLDTLCQQAMVIYPPVGCHPANICYQCIPRNLIDRLAADALHDAVLFACVDAVVYATSLHLSLQDRQPNVFLQLLLELCASGDLDPAGRQSVTPVWRQQMPWQWLQCCVRLSARHSPCGWCSGLKTTVACMLSMQLVCLLCRRRVAVVCALQV
jgi:hypothetical protein